MVSRAAASSRRLLNHAWSDDAVEPLWAGSPRAARVPDAHPDLRIAAADGWCGAPDDGEEPIGYRLVLSVLGVLCCGSCAVALGVLGGIIWINGLNWSAAVLIVGAALLASVGALTEP